MAAEDPAEDFRLLPWGFPIGPRFAIHWSFPLVLFVVPVLQGSKHGAWWGWVVAVAIPLLFCVVLFREFGRLLATRRFEAHPDRITLWPLGHLTTIGKGAEGLVEVKIALAGPIVSLLLLAFFTSAFAVTGLLIGEDFLDPFHWWPVSTTTGTSDFGGHVLYLTHKWNLIVLLVNLIPAWPLDGGRLVRGLLGTLLGKRASDRFARWLGLGSLFALFAISIASGWSPIACLAAGSATVVLACTGRQAVRS